MFISNWLIYLYGLIGNLRVAFTGIIFGGVLALVATFFMWLEYEDETFEQRRKIRKTAMIAISVSFFLSAFVPTEQTMGFITVNSIITEDNINFAGETAEEIIQRLSDIYVETQNRLNENKD